MSERLKINDIPTREQIEEIKSMLGISDPEVEALHYKNQLLKAGYSPDTAIAYSSDIKLILMDPTRAFADDLKPTTKIRRIISFSKWARLNGIEVKIKLPRVPKPLPRPITDDEFERLLLAASKSPEAITLTVAIYLMGHAGLRIGEVVRLKIKDIDLKEGLITVRKGKGRKDRVVPIPRALKAQLKSYLTLLKKMGKSPEDSILPGFKTKKTLWLKLRRLAEEAGVEGFTPHRLRHYAATRMVVQKKVPVVIAQKALGHSSVQTTLRYTKIRPEDIKKAFEEKGI